MATKRFDQLSKEEKEKILNSPGGKERVIKLGNSYIQELKADVEILTKVIRDKEEITVSWMTLTIVLSILQIISAFGSNFSQNYILSCLPSFAIALLLASFTLTKHPSITRPEYFVLEEEDKDFLLKRNEAEAKALQEIKINLEKNYNRKSFFAQFVGPSVMINSFITLIFIFLVAFFPKIIDINLSIEIGILSLITIPLLQKMLTTNIKYTTTFKLSQEDKN